MVAGHLELGRAGEEAAARHLTRRGYRIVARNWRRKGLEIDLIAKRLGTLVFVEVKTRGPGSLASPADALTREKQRRLVRAACLWLSENNAWDKACRFDLVSVVVADGSTRINRHKNVIDPALVAEKMYQPF